MGKHIPRHRRENVILSTLGISGSEARMALLAGACVGAGLGFVAVGLNFMHDEQSGPAPETCVRPGVRTVTLPEGVLPQPEPDANDRRMCTFEHLELIQDGKPRTV